MTPPPFSHDPLSQPRWGLQRKLIVSMLLVGVVPLMVGLGLALWQGSREIYEVNGESFKALAIETARKLDVLVADEIARTSRIANDPAIVAQLEARRDAARAIEEQGGFAAVRAAANEEWRRWNAQDPRTIEAITKSKIAEILVQYSSGSLRESDELIPQVVRAATKMLFVTDTHGYLVAARTTKPGYSNSSNAWWQGTFNKGTGQLYIEDVHFDERADAYVFSLSLPIMDSLRYEAIGVLHRVIDAKEFFTPSIAPVRFGKTGHVMLIDSRGIVIACPILPTGVQLSDADMIPLVTPSYPGWVRAPGDGHGGHDTSIIGFAPLPETSRVTNGTADIGLWSTFVWQSSDELFSPIRHLFTWITVFGSVAVVLLASLGYIAANRIVTPVRQLQTAARSIGRGEWWEPVEIKTGDELQELAEEFTRMNRQLESAFAGLTDQVALKTQEVQSLRHTTDQILDAVPTPIIMIDRQEDVRYVNRAGRDTFGISADSPSSIRLFELLPADQTLQEQVRQGLRAATQNGDSAVPASRERIRSSDTPVRDPLAQDADQVDPDARHDLRIGQRQYQYQWFRISGGSAGDEDRIGLVLRDATDERHRQDRMIQAEKSDSLGVLTAGIGHELNNPLFGIMGLGEALQDESDLERVKSYARDIVQHGRRMAAVIRDFTGVAAREAADQAVAVSVTALLDQALEALQATGTLSGIDVNKLYGPHGSVRATPDQLRQAFTNIIRNAVQAMQGRGLLRVKVVQDSGNVLVTIADSGPGIPKQHLAKVFDPFFTTKDQGEGSGLGLTVARRLVRKFGGDVRIESQEGQGTSCIVTLPIVTSPPSLQEESCSVSGSPSAPRSSRSS
jgi:signal transduction histidine kinase/HAMP domain-containing protein